MHPQSEQEQQLQHAVAIAPEAPQPLYELGNFYQYQAHRYPEARAAYEKAIELNPDQSDFWIGLGNVLKNHFSDYTGTESAYRKAIVLNPKDDMPHNNLGNLYTYFLFKADPAKTTLLKGLEIVQPGEHRRRALLHWNYGGILSVTGDLDRARQQFRLARDAFAAVENKLDGDRAWLLHQSTLIDEPLEASLRQEIRSAATQPDQVYTQRYWWFYQACFENQQAPEVAWEHALGSLQNHHGCLLLMRHLYSLAGMQPQHCEAMRPKMHDALSLWDSSSDRFPDAAPPATVVATYRRFRDGKSSGVGDPTDVASQFGV